MGFGLLLIGYMFAFVASAGMGTYLFAGMLIGGFLMYLGLCELRKYSPAFIFALVGSILIILCSFWGTMVWIDSFFSLGVGFSSGIWSTVYDWIKLVVNFAFNLALLFGISDLSRRVELLETRQKAIRNIILVILFNAYQILLFFPIGFIKSDQAFFLTILLILRLLYTILNAWLLFKCYAMICPEGQEDMPKKRSRFEFVNKIRDAKDAKEDKAIEEMKEYYESKLKAKNQKKRSKNKNKK
ncbi:MAG: hypothetical protein E7592_02255 [Ruminococcaceae bacterium]|nr:hypothetical protein [Oscillospiraceae bacterium]